MLPDIQRAVMIERVNDMHVRAERRARKVRRPRRKSTTVSVSRVAWTS